MMRGRSLYTLIFLAISVAQATLTTTIKYTPKSNQEDRIYLNKDQFHSDKQSQENDNVVIQEMPKSSKVLNKNKTNCKVWTTHPQNSSFFQFMTKKCFYKTNGTHLNEMLMDAFSEEKPEKFSRIQFMVKKFQTKPLQIKKNYSLERPNEKYNKTRKNNNHSNDILNNPFIPKEKKIPNFRDLFRFANREFVSLKHLIPPFGKWFKFIHFPFSRLATKNPIFSSQKSSSDRSNINTRNNLISRRIHAQKRIPKYKEVSSTGKIKPEKLIAHRVHSRKIIPRIKLISKPMNSRKITPLILGGNRFLSIRQHHANMPQKNLLAKRIISRKIPHKIPIFKKVNSTKNPPIKLIASRKRLPMPVSELREKIPLTSKTLSKTKNNEGYLSDTWPTNTLFTKSAKFNHNYIPSVEDLSERVNHVPKPHHRVPRSLKKFRGTSNDRAWMDQNSYRALFKEYYKCLDKKVADIKGELDSAIKPVLLMVGQSVELKCDICMRPDQNAAALGIDWQMMRRSDGVMKHISFNKKSRMRMTKDYTLHIMNTNMKDAGQYFCVVQNNYASVYQVDVLLNEKRIVMHEDSEDDRPEPPFVLDERNLKVSTVWTDWSFCDRCGQMGSQRKLGLCMVTKLDKNHPIEPEDFPMIDLYPDGIPCHSTALPPFLKRIPLISERPSETLVRDCMQECPTTPGPINITDKAGKVIEVLEPGFYSIHNPPTLPPITVRKVIYEDAGKHLVLSCPKQLAKVITIWKRGRVVIDPLSIRSLTRNRVFLDNANRLHIRKLFLTDTSSYLCFLRQEHVATFKVIVYEPLNQHLKDHISMIGMVITCVSSFIICLCLCAKKDKKTNK